MSLYLKDREKDPAFSKKVVNLILLSDFDKSLLSEEDAALLDHVRAEDSD